MNVRVSADRGRTWKKVGQGINAEDIHGVAVVKNGGKLVYATTNRGLNVSRDNGETFAFQDLDSPWQYTRTIVPRADGDRTVFLTNGNGPPGSTGRLLRSRDYGATFEDAGLPGTLNSTTCWLGSSGTGGSPDQAAHLHHMRSGQPTNRDHLQA